VWLVEDDPEIVALPGDVLAVEDFGIVSAQDAGGAVDALGTHAIACVLLDVMLPEASF
jgi:DNA-binding response OmpR family regulator